MATRASVIMKENGKPMLAVYKHWDGYPNGLGKKLESIINGGKLTNGLSGSPKMGEAFNGAGCLFASIIALLKEGPGDVYMTGLESVGQSGEDYIYEIDVNDKDVKLTHRENV